MIFWAALEYLPVLGPLIRIFMNGPPWRKNMLMGCCLIGISLPPHYYAHGNGGGGARSTQARKIAPASSPGNRSPESGVRSPPILRLIPCKMAARLAASPLGLRVHWFTFV